MSGKVFGNHNRQSGRGGGRGGRGGSHGNKNKKLEMKFHISGGGRSYATYTAVKEKLILKLQTKYGPQIAETIQNGVMYNFDSKKPKLEISKAEDEDKREIENEINLVLYKAEVRNFVDRKEKYNYHLKRTYSEIIEWCSDTIQGRIQECILVDAKIENDPLRLLEAIKRAVHQPARAVYEFSALIHTLKRTLNLKQMENESLADYFDRFKHERRVMKTSANFLDSFVENTKEYIKQEDEKEKEKLKLSAMEKMIAVLLLENADRKNYGNLVDDYLIQYANKNNLYPKTLTDMVDVMSKIKVKKKNQGGGESNNNRDRNAWSNDDSSSAASFAQRGQGGNNNNGNDNNIIQCYCCGELNHKSSECPKKSTIPVYRWWICTGQSHFQQTNSGASIPEDAEVSSNAAGSTGSNRSQSHWSGAQVLNCLQQLLDTSPGAINMRDIFVLDTGTTGHSAVNANFVYDIKELLNPVCQDTNAGSTLIQYDCKVPGLGEGMANCLSFAQLVDQCHQIVMDTAKDDAFYLYMKAGEDAIHVPCNQMNVYALSVGKNFLKKVTTMKAAEKKNCDNHQVVTTSLRPGAVSSVKDFTSIVEVIKDDDATAGVVNAGVESTPSHLQILKNKMEGFTYRRVKDAKKAMKGFHIALLPP